MPLSTWINDQRREGEPIQAGEWTIVPVSRAFTVQIPGLRGGMIFNRPTAVRVSQPDGSEKVLPVVDVTRLTILGIGLLALLAAVLARILIGKDPQ